MAQIIGTAVGNCLKIEKQFAHVIMASSRHWQQNQPIQSHVFQHGDHGDMWPVMLSDLST
jgi:hypothetical protein